MSNTLNSKSHLDHNFVNLSFLMLHIWNSTQFKLHNRIVRWLLLFRFDCTRLLHECRCVAFRCSERKCLCTFTASFVRETKPKKSFSGSPRRSMWPHTETIFLKVHWQSRYTFSSLLFLCTLTPNWGMKSPRKKV